ncbi:MAG: hypothetical protein IPJ75_14290 [Ignavibacteriales bacterium]|nr:hypothetical protein [Ignavibacteriales bacterium]
MKYLRYFLLVSMILLSTYSTSAQNGGNALTLDGTDDFIRVDAGAGTGLDYSGASEFTVSMWILPNNPLAVLPQLLFHKQNNGTLNDVDIQIYMENGGNLSCFIDNVGVGNFVLTGPNPNHYHFPLVLCHPGKNCYLL